MNWIDLIIIGMIGLSALMGFVRGLVKETLSLLIWIAAFMVASQFYLQLASLLIQIQDKMIRHGVAITLLFVGSLIIGSVVNYVIGQLVSKTGFSGTNMLLGMVFGSFRGVLIVAALLFFLDSFTHLSNADDWAKSQLIPHFSGVIEWFFVYLEQNSSFLPR